MLGLSFFLLASVLNAQKNRLEFHANFFYPSEKSVRDIYRSGVFYRLDLSTHLWRRLELHLDYGYFTQKGKLTFTKERTRIWLNPIGVSLRYVYLQKTINLYAGGGITYNTFRELNPIGETNQSKVGLMLNTGGFIRLKGFQKVLKSFIIGVHLNYNYCEMKPADIKFDSGGFDIGLTFGVEF